MTGAHRQADRATRPSDQAPAGLGDTASVPCAETPVVGRYAIVKGWGDYGVEEITRVTPKLVFTKHGSWRPSQRKHGDLTAHFADRVAAEQLAQSLNGAHGQYTSRCRAARVDYDARCQAAREAFDKTANRLIVKARGEQVSA